MREVFTGDPSDHVLLTGGAGFIGSHLLERLVAANQRVTILDNLSSGSMENIQRWMDRRQVRYVYGDCTKASDVQDAMRDVDVILHVAANPEIRLDRCDPVACFHNNIYATHVLLEAMRKSSAHTIIFTSSSTVYGDPTILPTPEIHPTNPISIYGSAKLASEALIYAYASTFNRRAIILRLANIIGPRSKHGVIHDFIQKLQVNPTQLTILGDGTQIKSYLHITDFVNAVIIALQQTSSPLTILNVGSTDQTSVQEIASIVVDEMNLDNVLFTYTGGVNGGRGWTGDVKTMLLEVQKLQALGWQNKYTSSEAVRETVHAYLEKIS